MTRINTPWGPAQTVVDIADGIRQVSTASHGGILLSPERWKQLKSAWPNFEPFGGRNGLEEDCDWKYAPLTWPSFFTARDVYYAVRSLKATTDVIDVEAYFQTDIGKAALECWTSEAEKVKNLWEVGSIGTGSGAYEVSVSRHGERKIVRLKEWPDRSFYTDGDLKVLLVKEAVEAHDYEKADALEEGAR